MDCERRVIDVAGARLAVEVTGEGPLVILLHGFPESSLTWRAYLEPLSQGHRLAVPDQRGFGRSDCPPSRADYRIERLVADVVAIADALGAERFSLVGHDWGGVVAWFAAAWFPDRIDNLVVVNAPHPTLFQHRLDQDPAQRAASTYIARFTNGPAPTPEALWLGTMAADEQAGRLDPAERTALRTAWARPGAIDAMLNWYRAAPFDFSAVGGRGLGRISEALVVRVPTAVIWGMDDPLLLPTLLDGLDALVPDLVIERIAGASHSILREQPALISSLLVRLLAPGARVDGSAKPLEVHEPGRVRVDQGQPKA